MEKWCEFIYLFIEFFCYLWGWVLGDTAISGKSDNENMEKRRGGEVKRTGKELRTCTVEQLLTGVGRTEGFRDQIELRLITIIFRFYFV